MSPQSITLAAVCRGSSNRQQKTNLRVTTKVQEGAGINFTCGRTGGRVRSGQFLEEPAGRTDGQEAEGAKGNSQASDPQRGESGVTTEMGKWGRNRLRC